MKVLELFAGTRSIGKAFQAKGHEVYSIEWDKSFEGISLYQDIMTVTADQILRDFGRPDVIWASPDCSTYSIAARTDTRWFHDYIYQNKNAEIRFIKGRLKFGGGAKNSAPFPSMIVVFGGDHHDQR